MKHTKLRERRYPHVYNGRFYNYPGEKKKHFLLPSLAMMIKSKLTQNRIEQDIFRHWIEPSLPLKESTKLVITWLGHSSFLIQVNGFNILTDPVFWDLPFFKRILPCGISIDMLPSIDFVLISHNHRDHMDKKSMHAIKSKYPQAKFLVPLGIKSWCERQSFYNCNEAQWWEQVVGDNGNNSVTFTFLPAVHWSQRGLFDFNKTLWGSWMVQANDRTIYFAGDTAYGSHFKDISYEFPFIDVALLPIGPCEPHNLMIHAHVNAEEAGQAFKDLNAHHFIPMHWGTYYFGSDSFDLPYKRLRAWWNNQTMPWQILTVPKIGQKIFLEEMNSKPTSASIQQFEI